MNRIQPKNGLSQMKKSAATGWRGLESNFGPENGNGESGGKEMRAGPSQSNLRSSKKQLPLFKLTMRAAICFVIEENSQGHGISLAELRRELIVRHLLVDVGML